MLRRVDRLAGLRLDEVAALLGCTVPPDLKRHKGWIGTLIEAVLGADAGSRPVPDFEALQIELKTIPVDRRGRVRGSTFVTTAPLNGQLARRWRESRVHEKLRAVLWVPVVEDGRLGARLVGQGVLWRPTAAEEATLRRDWEELTEMLVLGEVGEVDGRRGRALQLRPKAATASAYTWTLDEEGEWVQAGTLAFYLRARFTQEVLERHLQR